MSNDDYWLSSIGITTEVIGQYAQYGVWAVVISIVLYLAWWTTSRSPLDYHAWLVRLQILDERRRLVHVTPMNLESEGEIVAPHRATNNSVVSLSAAGSRDRDRGEEHTTVLVIEGPSAIRSSPNAGAGADRSSGTNNNNFRFDVPATTAEGEQSENEGENITEIHRFLRSHADGPIATAATIALYNRRFTQGERSNQLLVSRLSMSVESEAEPSPDNVLISYDNLQSSAVVGNSPSNNSPRRNIIFESDEDDTTTPTATNSADTASGTHQSNDEDSPPSRSPSSESRLERPVVDGPEVAIKLKFLDDSQKSVRACLNVKVGEFKRLNFSDSLAEGKVIRLIFKGGLLRDDSRSLASYGLHDQCVLHCHIGNRPYTQGREGDAGGQTETRTRPRRRLISPMSHILHSRIGGGVYWLDLLLVALFNGFARVWNWAQNEETADGGDSSPPRAVQEGEMAGNTEQPQPRSPRPVTMYQRTRRTTRHFLRVLLNCLFDLNAQGSGDETAMEDNQFNVGILLGFVFAMKFIALWTIVFYYPQFVDPKGVFMLSILTAFATLYFYCNRATLARVT